MTVVALRSKVGELSHLALSLHHKIAGNPNGYLSGLVDKIKETVEETVKKLLRPIRGFLEDIEDLVGKIPSKLSDMVEGIKDAVTDAIGKIPEALGDLIGKISEALGDVVDKIKDKIKEAFDKLAVTFRAAIESIKSYFQSFIQWAKEIPDTIRRAVANTIIPFILSLREKIGDLISAIKRKIGEWAGTIRTLATRIWAAITELARKFKDAIVETYRRVEEAIRTFIHNMLMAIRLTIDRIREAIAKAVDFIFDKALPFFQEVGLETEIGLKKRIPAVKNLVLGTIEGNADMIRDAMDNLLYFKTYKDVTSIAMAWFVALAVLPQGIGAMADPAIEVMRQEARERMPVELLPLTQMITLYYRGLVGPGDVLAEGLKAGISQDKVGALVEGLRPLPSPGQIQEAYLRGYISEEKHDELLRKHGYRQEDINLFKALYWIIPGPSDLIRMAVREAFTPEVVERFKMDEGFPEVFANWAAKQGLSREWALNYWRAHWQLPSVTQGFEMFHRTIDREGNTVISKDELMLLLKTLDIMPFWREKLLAISYAPYTRVDVRRMYQLGILDERGVYLAYRDLGYDDEKARNLTEFTIRYYTTEEKTELEEYRELTRSVILAAFAKGVLTRAETKARLTSIGYHPDDAELLIKLKEAQTMIEDTTEPKPPLLSKTVNLVLTCYKRGLYDRTEVKDILASLGKTEWEINWYIALSDYEVAEELKLLALEVAEQNYIQRTWSWIDVQAYLGRLNLSRGEVEALKRKWDIEREARTRKPTEAQFRAALYAGLIDIEEYKEELRGLGYPEKYVKLLADLAIARRRS